MTLRRFNIRPLSPWTTPMRSDMLNGLLLYRIAEDEGDEAVETTIGLFAEGKVPFACSSAVPYGCLPMPKTAPASRDTLRELARKGTFGKHKDFFEVLQEVKKFSKVKWVPLSIWQRVKGQASFLALFKEYCKEADCGGWRLVETGGAPLREPHVTVSRSTGSAVDGGLFFRDSRCYAEGTVFHLYAEAEDQGALLARLKRIGLLGFGKDASSGRGQFSIEADESFSPSDLPSGPHHLLLSEFSQPRLPQLDDLYSMEVRRGRTGTMMGRNPFKAPFLCLQEGSVLKSIPVGSSLLQGIHVNPKVVQVVHPVTVPCTLE